MIDFIKSLFKKKPVITPNVGDLWILRSTYKNPFERVYAYVKDVKEGYVLYAMRHNLTENSKIFQNESCTVKEFNGMYQPQNTEKGEE